MKAPSKEQLLEQNGKSNTYDCVMKCDCYSSLINICPQTKLLIMFLGIFYSPVLCDAVHVAI